MSASEVVTELRGFLVFETVSEPEVLSSLLTESVSESEVIEMSFSESESVHQVVICRLVNNLLKFQKIWIGFDYKTLSLNEIQ